MELVAGEPRRIGAVGHGEAGLAGDRPRRGGDGEGECFERRARGGHGAGGGGRRQLTRVAALESGSSSPKQRW